MNVPPTLNAAFWGLLVITLATCWATGENLVSRKWDMLLLAGMALITAVMSAMMVGLCAPNKGGLDANKAVGIWALILLAAFALGLACGFIGRRISR